MRQIRIGKIVLTDGGEWNISSTYAKLTWVLHNGDAWWSTVNNVASEPADTNPAWVRATSVQRFIQAIQTAIADADSLTKDVEKAEQLRQDAENLRIAKEEQRNKDNAAYKVAEEARQKEELHREENEKLRVSNEKQRIEDFADFLQQCASQYIEAEADRDTAFAEAEAARSRGEQNRVYAEGERVNSETIRQQTFERAMTDAETATQLAEETAAHPTYIGEDFYVYVWDSGTKAYSKTNIFVKGEGFSISKTYTSIAEMEADSANIVPGSFVLISNDNTEDPDNAKMYLKTTEGLNYIVDLSGSVGFTGKTPQLAIGTVTAGTEMATASASIERVGTDADGNPTYQINLLLPVLSYNDLTPAQIAQLQQPAKDMIATLNATNESVKAEEAKRATAEGARQQAESVRVGEENFRIQEETNRRKDEQIRYENEEKRIIAENARVKAERERAVTDAERQSLYDTVSETETERIKNENQRKEAENARAEAEASRVQEENARVMAENDRAKAEAARTAEWTTLKQNAVVATTSADTAASNANSKATLAENAATLAVEKAGIAQTATINADEKAAYAKEQGDYAKAQGDAAVAIINENVGKVNSVEASLEALIGNFEEQGNVHAQTLDIDALPTICTFPLFRIEEKDPDVTPDFIGQIWINKTGNTVYVATHCNSAAGYKAI